MKHAEIKENWKVFAEVGEQDGQAELGVLSSTYNSQETSLVSLNQ